MTLKQFQAAFPTDEACLDHLMRTRWGERFECVSCGREARYYRVAKRRCYECEHCAYQVYPTAGTPFEKTRTPLTVWFHVMFLFCTTRNGVAAKEVQRITGVTYKTAWRMCHEIRKYMGYVDGDHPMDGGPDAEPVEIDKAFIGGKDKIGQDDKAIVLGIAQRDGDVVNRRIHSRGERDILPRVVNFVRPGTTIYTDTAHAFWGLKHEGYDHHSVNHAKKEYVRGKVHTNTIEGFWAAVKRGISGTYVWVSKKHLQKYLWEFEFRHNLRHAPWLMFDCLLTGFAKGARRTP